MSVTYLLGAGASINCLPIVKGIPHAYSQFIRRYEELLEAKYGKNFSDIEHLDSEDPEDIPSHQYEFYVWLQKFEQPIHEHTSIDTYAKKLYLSGKTEDLRHYKYCLAVFFTFEQIRVGPDIRYDAFFASILDSNISDFPKNLKLVSWNYDLQFEISYAAYMGEDSVERISDNFTFIAGSNSDQIAKLGSKFHVVKLNGSLDIWDFNQRGSSYLLNSRDYRAKRKFGIKDMRMTALFFDMYKSNLDSTTFSFAWEYEKNVETNEVIDHAIQSTTATKILVVIGYSFPFVNRHIDRKIIDNMEGLEIIYMQDPKANEIIPKVKAICERVKRNKDVLIQPIFDTSQFHVPYQLD